MSQIHHAGKEIAMSRYALARELAGEFDGDYWIRRRLAHQALSKTPIERANAIRRLIVLCDGNPALPAFLKSLVHDATPARSDRGNSVAPLSK